MSNLTPGNGTHETEPPESRWAQKFLKAFMRVSVEEQIKGFDIGENFYQFNHGNQIVTITFKVKQ